LCVLSFIDKARSRCRGNRNLERLLFSLQLVHAPFDLAVQRTPRDDAIQPRRASELKMRERVIAMAPKLRRNRRVLRALRLFYRSQTLVVIPRRTILPMA
jgi:hypothetical protein